MIDWFDCDETVNMDEYVRWKLECDYDNVTLKFTQPVLPQLFKGGFDLNIGKAPKNTAPVWDILMKDNPEKAMPDKYQKVYIYGVGKLFQWVKWSILECINRVREL